MPEAQLTEPLDHAAEKGGVKETFAALEAAVEADVDAFLQRGSVNAQDFETLLQTVQRRALATATVATCARFAPTCSRRTFNRCGATCRRTGRPVPRPLVHPDDALAARPDEGGCPHGCARTAT